MVKKKAIEKKEDKFFKYFLVGFVIIVIVAAILLNNEEEKQVIVVNQGDVVMHYFYLDTCPHCKDQEEYHNTLLLEYPNLKILEYEMTSQASREKYLELTSNIEGFDNSRVATPTTIIGNQYNIGYVNDLVTGGKLKEMIEKELNKQNNTNE